MFLSLLKEKDKVGFGITFRYGFKLQLWILMHTMSILAIAKQTNANNIWVPPTPRRPCVNEDHGQTVNIRPPITLTRLYHWTEYWWLRNLIQFLKSRLQGRTYFLSCGIFIKYSNIKNNVLLCLICNLLIKFRAETIQPQPVVTFRLRYMAWIWNWQLTW